MTNKPRLYTASDTFTSLICTIPVMLPCDYVLPDTRTRTCMWLLF